MSWVRGEVSRGGSSEGWRARDFPAPSYEPILPTLAAHYRHLQRTSCHRRPSRRVGRGRAGVVGEIDCGKPIRWRCGVAGVRRRAARGFAGRAHRDRGRWTRAQRRRPHHRISCPQQRATTRDGGDQRPRHREARESERRGMREERGFSRHACRGRAQDQDEKADAA